MIPRFQVLVEVGVNVEGARRLNVRSTSMSRCHSLVSRSRASRALRSSRSSSAFSSVAIAEVGGGSCVEVFWS